MIHDVLIAGGGPAGAVAAIVLARAGARVLVVDRARFPRSKLCGDTVNPGALDLLRRLELLDAVAGGLPLRGMIVTGEPRVRVVGTYGRDAHGVSLSRRVLDARLLDAAAAAGAHVREQVLVQKPVLDANGTCVTGVEVATAPGGAEVLRARVVIAADGRFSRVARPLRLSRSARSPRRWALGAYFEGVAGLGDRGEMHVRRRHYIGVAPLPGSIGNACLVTADQRMLRSREALVSALSADPILCERFADARMIGTQTLLGPLAVDATAAGMPGLLLAGDAAGFVDPVTGDGLRFAFRGGELAAREAMAALQDGWRDAHVRLERARRAEFAGKWRFNRALRSALAVPLYVRAAAAGAAIAPAVFQRMIQYAGDAR